MAHRLARISILVSAGLVLYIFESYIPRPLPWIKPGLANIASLLALALYGFRTGLSVTLLRVLIASFIMGSFLNPAFILAAGAGIAATCTMGAIFALLPEKFSIIGISIAGAFAHNVAQICLASIFLFGNSQIFYLLPVLTLSSLLTGFLVGIVAHFSLQRMSGVGDSFAASRNHETNP
ncbi:Gx transporter family protein [candidate division KSB1 bacterium]|nr:Gx transporter family protein [candidate division KSB1 bacterium]